MGESDDISWEVPVNSTKGAGFGHGFPKKIVQDPGCHSYQWLEYDNRDRPWWGSTQEVLYIQGHCGEMHSYRTTVG